MLMCPCCRKRSYGDSCVSERVPYGSRFVHLDYYDTECSRCGEEMQEAFACADCGILEAEENTVEKDGNVYCTECRAECEFCGDVVKKSDIIRVKEHYRGREREALMCPECAKEAEEVA